ncbi:MAG: lipoprotein LpqH [Aeromicrobium sp.]
MIRSRITYVAAVGLSVTLGVGMAGCGSSKSDTKSTTTDTKTSAPASGGGSSSVVVDGKKWTGNFTTSCAKQGDTLALAIADPSGDATKGAGATIKGDNTVQAVAVGDATKGGAGYAAGTPGGKASVAKDGDTYTVSGVAISVDMADPTAQKKVNFKIVFACESIVGG